MKDVLVKLNSIKEKVEDARRKKSKLQGRLDAAMEHLNELGYSDIESAQKALQELQLDLDERTKELEIKLENFNNEYADIL